MLDICNVLSDTDRETMTEYIRNFADADTSMPQAPIEKVLAAWANEKEDLYNLLGKNLTLTKHILTSKPRSVIEEEIEDLTNNKFFSIWDKFYEFINKIFPSSGHEAFENRHNVKSLLNFETLINNKYEGPEIILPACNGCKEMKITSGMKAMRAITKIMTNYKLVDPDVLEQFRIAHSVIFNDKTFDCDMVLSIHPMDYMTMSDNANNWSSCMSWQEQGEYHAGTVEMMNSPFVLEAYIPSSQQELCFNGYTWNSKRWRELFIVDKTFAMAIKGYPYWERSLEEIVLRWIAELADQNWGVKYNETIDNFNPKEYWHNRSYKFGSFGFTTNYMYNDICYNADYPILVTEEFFEEKKDKLFNYSGEAICVYCGQKYIYATDSVCCSNCASEKEEEEEYDYYCANCGVGLYSEDEYWVNDLSDPICYDCYCSRPNCDCCGERYATETITLSVINDKNKYDPNLNFSLCEECGNLIHKRYGGKYHKVVFHDLKTYTNYKWIGIPYNKLLDLTSKKPLCFAGDDIQSWSIDDWNEEFDGLGRPIQLN